MILQKFTLGLLVGIKSCALFWLVCLYSTLSLAQDVPWERKPSFDLGLRAGLYDGDEASLGISVNYSGAGKWHVGASYVNSDSELADIKSSNVYVSSDLSAPFVARLSYSTSKQADILDSSDIELAGGFNLGNWYVEGSYVSGDLEVGNPFIQPDVLTILNQIGLLSAERDGFGIEVNYFATQWVLRLAYGNYEFERDGELTLASLQQALQQLTLQQRIDLLSDIRGFRQDRLIRLGRLSNASSYQAYRNAVTVADEEISIDYTYVFEKFALGAGYWWTAEVLSDEETATYYFSGDYTLSETTSIGALVSTSDEDSNVYAEVNVRFSW